MNCNVCGAEIPAGASTCPVCGAAAPGAAPEGGYSMAGGNAAPSNPFGADPANFAAQQAAQQAQQAQAYGGYDPNQGGYVDPYAQPAPAALAPMPKKSHTGLIIGIIAGVAVIGALVVMWVLGVFGGGKGTDGTYKLNAAKMYGVEVNEDQLSSFGLDVDKFKIVVKGDKATLEMAGQSTEVDVKFSGSTVTFSGGGESIDGTYSEGSGTITISYTGVEMTFKK